MEAKVFKQYDSALEGVLRPLSGRKGVEKLEAALQKERELRGMLGVDAVRVRLQRRSGWGYRESTFAFGFRADDLWAEQRPDLAEKVLELDEALYPEFAGLSRAWIQARITDRAGGLVALRAIASDEQRTHEARIRALHALESVDAADDALEVAQALLTRAIGASQFDDAVALTSVLRSVLVPRCDREQSYEHPVGQSNPWRDEWAHW